MSYYGYKAFDYYQTILDKLIMKTKDDRILNRIQGIIMGDDAKRFERVQKLLDDFNISVSDLLCSDSEDEESNTPDNSEKSEEKSNTNDSKKEEKKK